MFATVARLNQQNMIYSKIAEDSWVFQKYMHSFLEPRVSTHRWVFNVKWYATKLDCVAVANQKEKKNLNSLSPIHMSKITLI